MFDFIDDIAGFFDSIGTEVDSWFGASAADFGSGSQIGDFTIGSVGDLSYDAASTGFSPIEGFEGFSAGDLSGYTPYIDESGSIVFPGDVYSSVSVGDDFTGFIRDYSMSDFGIGDASSSGSVLSTVGKYALKGAAAGLKGLTGSGGALSGGASRGSGRVGLGGVPTASAYRSGFGMQDSGVPRGLKSVDMDSFLASWTARLQQFASSGAGELNSTIRRRRHHRTSLLGE